METESLEEHLKEILSILRKIVRKQSQVSEDLQSIDHTPVGLKRLRKDEAHEKVDKHKHTRNACQAESCFFLFILFQIFWKVGDFKVAIRYF